MEQLDQPVKKKRGRPRKTPEEKIKAPSPTKQFPITFKCNSELEMDLYDHLLNKYYRGAYIKEILIAQMFKERPDIAVKYGANVIDPVTPPPIQYTPPSQPVTPVEIVPDVEPEPDTVEPEPTPEPPKIKRGANTINMF